MAVLELERQEFARIVIIISWMKHERVKEFPLKAVGNGKNMFIPVFTSALSGA